MSHNFPKFQHLLLACLMAGMADVAEAGSVQFSTYYPAPFGMYDRLRLVPRANLDAQLPCDPGTLYINNDAGNQLEVCNAAGDDWAPLSGGPWTEDINGVYVTDTAANVGIGTTTPNSKLEVVEGGVIIRGNNLACGIDGDCGAGGKCVSSICQYNLTVDGNVGIGTTAPTSRLHINAPEGDTPPGVFLENADITVNGGADGVFGLRNNSATGTQKISIGGPGLGTETMMIDVLADRVGIGTTTPNNTLQVSGLVNFNDAKFSTSIGKSAGSVNTGDYNSFFGYQAGFSNTTADQNTAIGYQALYSANTGSYNTATGRDALRDNTIGSGNTAIGTSALHSNTTGSSNTASGMEALYSNTTGGSNTASGIATLHSNTTGIDNTASGNGALYSNTTGNYNTAIGSGALHSNTTGINNTASGYQALYFSTIGSFNTAYGNNALHFNTTGANNTAYGNTALYSNTTGANNTAYGNTALYSNTTGANNTAYGNTALYSNTTGNYNTATGVSALYSNTTGDSNTANGYNALSAKTIGSNNTAIGYSAGINITSGSRNIVIGSNIYAPSATGNNQLSIGNLIFGTGLDGIGTTVSTGNIGIGTNAPAARLEVTGGPIKATGGMILPTCTIVAGDCPASPVNGQIWLCTDC